MKFSVLGPVTVTEGLESLNIGGPKQRTVLAMLIAYARKPLAADAIAQAVYGLDVPDSGKRRVQTYVSTLRSIVRDVIVKDGSAWSLDVDRGDIDAARFEDLYESARSLDSVAAGEVLREALGSWRGRPYSDVESHGFLEAEITRLIELRVSAQHARIAADLESGRDADLVGDIEALLVEHPYQEGFRAHHMLALYRAGRQAEALRSYEQMRSLLVDELGVDPGPELQDLELRILNQDDSLLLTAPRSVSKQAVEVAERGTRFVSASVGVSRTLLERDAELDLLSGVLAGVGSAGGKVVLVRGEAGVGKTSLVREFVHRHSGEAHVVWGFCDDLTTPEPLAPFWDMARFEPKVLDALRSGSRRGFFETVIDVLSHRRPPAVMVIEDAQWAAEATLDAVAYVGRRIRDTNGLLVLTYRDEEVDFDHPLRGIVGDLAPSDVVRVRLECLTADGVATLLEATQHDFETVWRLTDGNPLFVTEILEAAPDAVPRSIRDTTLGKAARLSSTARETLKALAVIPQQLPLPRALELTDPTGEGLVECERHGFVEVGETGVGFRNELIRRAVEESLTVTERIMANGRVLEVLPSDTHPAQLAHHATEAGDVEAILEFVPQAATAASAVGSHREAAAHYRTLEPYLDRLDPATKGDILDAWGHEERIVAEFDKALWVNDVRGRHHRQHGDRAAESAALAETAYNLNALGRGEEAEESAARALDVLQPEQDGPGHLPALEALGYFAMMSNDVQAAIAWVDRALNAAGPDADELLIIRCLINRASALDMVSYPEGRASIDELAERAAKAGFWGEAGRALHNHAWAAAQALDLTTALNYAERSMGAAQREDLPGTAAYAAFTLAQVLDLTGAWSKAEDIAWEVLDVSPLYEAVGLPMIGAIEARQGRPGARDHLLEGERLARNTVQYDRIAPAAAALAEYAWITGDDTGIPIQDCATTLDTGLEISPGMQITGALALWLWKLGELADTPEGIAEPYRLMIEGEPTAATMWAEIGCPYQRAIALSDGDHTARLEALEILDTLGATAVATKLRQTMRDQGMTVPRSKAHATARHPAGLTARQAEILDLLAEGLSITEIADQLFLAPRTVEHHASAVLSKLDATTITEAVAAAKEQGLLSTV